MLKPWKTINSSLLVSNVYVEVLRSVALPDLSSVGQEFVEDVCREKNEPVSFQIQAGGWASNLPDDAGEVDANVPFISLC